MAGVQLQLFFLHYPQPTPVLDELTALVRACTPNKDKATKPPTCVEDRCAIQRLNDAKTAGIHGISPRLLKKKKKEILTVPPSPNSTCYSVTSVTDTLSQTVATGYHFLLLEM